MVQEGNEFCPHCGRNLSDTDHITEEEFQAYSSRSRGHFPWFLLICCVLLMLPALFGFFMPHGEPAPEYGPMDRTVTWDMYDYKNLGIGSDVKYTGEPVHTFTITYTVDEEELSMANRSNIDREGSQLAERDAHGHHAVKDYVVVGKTVNKLSQTLWKTYSDFVSVSGNEQYKTAEYFADYLLSFVEVAVEYAYDSDEYGKDEYWLYPVETLYSNKGDCEDTSILLCAIYCSMAAIHETDPAYAFSPDSYIRGACCFGLPGHFMTGVMISGAMSDADYPVYSYKGTYGGSTGTYYFCETTGEADSQFPLAYTGMGHSYVSFYPGSVSTYVTA